MEQRIKEVSLENSRVQEQLQQSAAAENEELENLKRDKELFHMETEVLNLTAACFDLTFNLPQVLKKSAEDAERERKKLSKELEVLVQQKTQLLGQIDELTGNVNQLEGRITACKFKQLFFDCICCYNDGKSKLCHSTYTL